MSGSSAPPPNGRLACYMLADRIASLFFCCWFFFSSRRRHTRLVSDWSSDVCSSDLMGEDALAAARALAERPTLQRLTAEGQSDALPPFRSEERRVGKEWRSRWSPYQ